MTPMAPKKKNPPIQLTPSMAQMRSLLSPSQVADMLGLTTRRVIQMIDADEIFAKQFGRHGWAIERAEAMRVYRERSGR